MGRRTLLTIAGLLALAAAGAIAVYALAAPTVLKVAVPPGEDHKLIEAYKQWLDRERADVRLRLILTQGLKSSAEALEKSETDLAIIRTDVAVPTGGQTIAVLHEDSAIIIAPEMAQIGQVSDLAGKRLGIVVRHRSDLPLFERIAAHYGLAQDIALKAIEPGEALKAVTDKVVDAVAFVGAPTDPEVTALVNGVDQVTEGTVVIVPVAQAEAIVQKAPVLQATKIVAGAFGGRPPRPLDEVKTLAVTYRLVARSTLDDGIAASLTRHIFDLRPRIARALPLANLIEAPSTSKSAALPVHPGAANYLDDEEETFFEKYGDWIYILMAVMGGLGSAAAALASRMSNRKDQRADRLLERLLSILKEARHSTDPEELNLLSLEVDVIVAEAVHYARESGAGQAVRAISLAIEGARAAIAEQRNHLSRQPQAAAPGPATQGLAAQQPAGSDVKLAAIEGGAGRL